MNTSDKITWKDVVEAYKRFRSAAEARIRPVLNALSGRESVRPTFYMLRRVLFRAVSPRYWLMLSTTSEGTDQILRRAITKSELIERGGDRYNTEFLFANGIQVVTWTANYPYGCMGRGRVYNNKTGELLYRWDGDRPSSYTIYQLYHMHPSVDIILGDF